MLKKLKKTKNIIRRYVYWRHGWKMTAAVLVIVFTLGIASYSMLHVSADTAILVPDGDVTGAWGSPGTGGTNDGSCSGGTRCNFVDEGVTDKTTDYITTGLPWVVHIEREHGVPTMTAFANEALDAAIDAALSTSEGKTE